MMQRRLQNMLEGQMKNSNLIGKKIRIINMNGEPYYTGRIGTVTDIDDIGQIHGTWGGLAIIDGEDEYRVIDD